MPNHCTDSNRSIGQGRFTESTVKTYDIPDDLLPKENKILIVDDDQEFASTLGEILRADGWSIVQVPDGKQAVRTVMTSEFDVILCDMVMPGFPGDMFYRAVERVRPQLCSRFVFVTGHGADPRINEFIRSVHGLPVWKPFRMQELYSAVRTVLTRKSPPRRR